MQQRSAARVDGHLLWQYLSLQCANKDTFSGVFDVQGRLSGLACQRQADAHLGTSAENSGNFGGPMLCTLTTAIASGILDVAFSVFAIDKLRPCCPAPEVAVGCLAQHKLLTRPSKPLQCWPAREVAAGCVGPPRLACGVWADAYLGGCNAHTVAFRKEALWIRWTDVSKPHSFNSTRCSRFRLL